MKKIISILLTLVMLAVCAAALATEAVDSNDATKINTDKGIDSTANTIRIVKQIVCVNAENTTVREPNIEYTYTIASVTPGTATITDANSNIGNVKAGPIAAVTGGATATTSTVTFADTATVAATANGTASDAKYASFTFDPSKFKDDSNALSPGIYRYSITETCSPTKASVGITEPDGYNAGRFLDVYVKWNDDRDALEIYGYVLFEGEATTSIASPTVTMKSAGYVNTSTTAGTQTDVDIYTTQNLYINKTTTGTLADKGHYFPVTVTLTAPTGVTPPKMDVTVTNATLTFSTDTVGAYTAAWGNVAGTVKDGGQIAIKGIPAGTKAKIVETNDTADAYKVKAGTTSDDDDLLAEAVVAAGQPSSATSEVTMSTAKGEIFITNTLDSISPTGYVTRFAPYALMLIGGIALLIVAKKHRKHSDEEE